MFHHACHDRDWIVPEHIATTGIGTERALETGDVAAFESRGTYRAELTVVLHGSVVCCARAVATPVSTGLEGRSLAYEKIGFAGVVVLYRGIA